MRSSWKLFLGVYLLGSAGLYLAVTGLLDIGVWLAVPIGFICLLQVLFAVTAGSLRYVGRMATVRLLLCSVFAAAPLVVGWTGGWWIVWIRLLGLSVDRFDHLMLPLLGLTWIAVTILLWVWCRRQDRLVVVLRLAGTLAAAMALELAVGAGGCAYVDIIKRPHGPWYAMTARVIVFNLLILAWAVGPLLVWLYYRRVRRQMRGVCVACGYDLRGLSQQCCPECGRAFTLEEVHATAEELAISEIDAAGSSEATGR